MCTCVCGCVWTGMCVHVYVCMCMCALVCACWWTGMCVCVDVDGQVEKRMCGPQQCTVGSLVFVHRMVLEIDVFFLIPFSIVCLVEAIRLVKGINNNSSILRTTQCTTTDFHQCAAEDLHIPLISAS